MQVRNKRAKAERESTREYHFVGLQIQCCDPPELVAIWMRKYVEVVSLLVSCLLCWIVAVGTSTYPRLYSQSLIDGSGH